MQTKWILISDGTRAKIIEKSAGGIQHIGPTHHMDEQESHKDEGHHKPGSVSSALVHARHSFPDHSEWGRFEKEDFAAMMANVLNKNEASFSELVLMAPPKNLGDLRKFLSKNCLDKVIKELAKDYTHTPLREIEEFF